MNASNEVSGFMDKVKQSLRTVSMGLSQIMLCDKPATGALFLTGLLINSPLMAAGAVLGSTVGTLAARALRYDRDDMKQGLFGFNAALVGIATFVKFTPSLPVMAALCGGAILSTLIMKGMKRLPIPAYTAPFVLSTWVLWKLGEVLKFGSAAETTSSLFQGVSKMIPDPFGVLHGVGQVMFQDSSLSGLAFALGIFLSTKCGSGYALLASIAAGAVASLCGAQSSSVLAGLFGYNAALCALALKDNKSRALGTLLCLPIGAALSYVGIPVLTAPFVVSTWIASSLDFRKKEG